MKLTRSLWGKEARKKMVERDLSVTKLAQEIGLSRPYVSSVLTGRIFSVDAIFKISNYLGIDPGEDAQEEATEKLSEFVLKEMQKLKHD